MRMWTEMLRPHKSIPTTPWSAIGPWDLNPIRICILFVGLTIFGLGDSLLIKSGLGNAPWTVLAQGFASSADISIGLATFIISSIVLLLWIPFRQRPGFGTLANIAIIAVAIQIGISLFPAQESLVLRYFYVIAGIILVGIGSSLYITCGLGPGPRDGWMTALHRKTGAPVARVRFSIELSVLTVGWLLGGTVGVGTALFATLIGYSVALAFGVVARLTHR